MRPTAVMTRRTSPPLWRQVWPQVQVRAEALFFSFANLLLQSGGEGVAGGLAGLVKNDAFTGIENLPRRGRPGSLLQLLSIGKGLFDNHGLEIRLRDDGGTRHPVFLLSLSDSPVFTIFLQRKPCLPETVGALRRWINQVPLTSLLLFK